MPQILEPLADRTAPSPGTTAAVLALFAASGCAALIYQVVWFEQLSLAIGSSALSLAVLLATFMGGLGLGSLLASRGTGASYAPLRRYALVELGIGVLGLVTLAAIPLLAGAYTALSGTGGLALLLRLVVAALALLPATMLMGATLPIVAPWLQRRPARRRAARLVLCGQYRRRRRGQPPRRVLPAARARRVRRDVRRGRAEHRQRGGCRGALAPQRGAVGCGSTGRCAARKAAEAAARAESTS